VIGVISHVDDGLMPHHSLSVLSVMHASLSLSLHFFISLFSIKLTPHLPPNSLHQT